MEEKKEKDNSEVVVAPVEEKKNHKRRAILLLLLLLITGFLLTTSTYAWFTSNTTVSVNNITVNVATQNGIQISADAINYKSVLSTTDLTGAHSTYAAAKNQLPSSLEPVSTALAVNNDLLTMFYGVVDTNDGGDYILTASDVTTLFDNSDTVPEGTYGGSTGKFVAFDLFVKLDGVLGTSTPIYMTGAGSGVTADSSTGDTGIKNAARIAFLVLGDDLTSKVSGDIQAITGGTTVYLWEPNYDAHTNTGVNNATNVYGVNGLTASTGNAYVSYDGVNSTLDSSYDIKLGEAKTTHATYGSKFTAITPNYKTTELFSSASSTSSELVFNLRAGYVTKIRVYFWVEGQDVDCENGASGGTITLNLTLTTNAPGGTSGTSEVEP